MASKRPMSGILAAGLVSPVSGFVPGHRKLAVSQSQIEVAEYVGITKSHWIAKTSRTVCKSRSCRSKFTLINSPKNCYKCGDVYCKQCVRQTRRLSLFANYDPQGKFYNVCKLCFDSEQQSTGATRNLMKGFRLYCRGIRQAKESVCRNGFALAEERIHDGFLAQVNSTPNIVRKVQSLTINFAKGAWTKPVKSVGNDSVCRQCQQKFELVFRSRHQCSICGVAVCTSCSNKDLIVYIEDEKVSEDNLNYTEAAVKLIRITGGPHTEPQIHEYLRICTKCYEAKKCRQGQKEKDVVDNAKHQDNEAFWTRLCSFHDKLLVDQRRIEQSLEKYETLVRSLEDGSGKTSQGSNVQTLSKAQIDLSDSFYSYQTKVAKLKQFVPISVKTGTLLSNIRKSSAMFYSENRALFSELKSTLEEYLPIAIIETIQNQVNRTALECVHLLVRQLGLEVFTFTDEEFGDKALNIAQQLADAEQVIAEELKSVLCKLEGDEMSWKTHEVHANDMLKLSLKDHKLIKRTPYLMSHPEYLLNEVISRSCEVLDQINRRLESKTTQTSYTLVKDTIQQVRKAVLEAACNTNGNC